MRKLRFWVAAAALGLAGNTLAQTTPSPAPAPADPPRPAVPVARVEPVDLNAPSPAHHAHGKPSRKAAKPRKGAKPKKAAHKPARKPAHHAKRRHTAKP